MRSLIPACSPCRSRVVPRVWRARASRMKSVSRAPVHPSTENGMNHHIAARWNRRSGTSRFASSRPCPKNTRPSTCARLTARRTRRGRRRALRRRRRRAATRGPHRTRHRSAGSTPSIRCRASSQRHRNAGELSLAENVVRIAMHPADQMVAISHLAQSGATVAHRAPGGAAAPGSATRRPSCSTPIATTRSTWKR